MTLHNEYSYVSGIDFIDPNLPSPYSGKLDKISASLSAPRIYANPGPLARHMANAIEYAALDLSVRRHVNFGTGRDFECVSYYADDADIVAFCACHHDVYLATIGAPYVRTLVKICDRIGPFLQLGWPSPGRTSRIGQRGPDSDETLKLLIDGATEVSEQEALAIVSSWPAVGAVCGDQAFGAVGLFYDLVRLIWLHEWAHALCGHVRLASHDLGISRLFEFSTERIRQEQVERLGGSRSEVLQLLELHADEFATTYCIGHILDGFDPIANFVGPNVDLVKRIFLFNVACCVLTVLWSAAEERLGLGQSDFAATHPPSPLRYLRFRGFQRDQTHPSPRGVELLTAVDSVSYTILEVLSRLDWRFNELYRVTPMVARTPDMDQFEAYEAHLLGIGTAVEPLLAKYGFVPTFDPWASDDTE